MDDELHEVRHGLHMERMTLEQYMEILDNLPPVVPKPCEECPFRRDSVPGHIGPYAAHDWPNMAHAEGPIACHMTIKGDEGWGQDGMKQCAGAAIFRANIMKSPRHPKVARLPADKQLVFAWDDELIAHHAPESSHINQRGSHG